MRKLNKSLLFSLLSADFLLNSFNNFEKHYFKNIKIFNVLETIKSLKQFLRLLYIIKRLRKSTFLFLIENNFSYELAKLFFKKNKILYKNFKLEQKYPVNFLKNINFNFLLFFNFFKQSNKNFFQTFYRRKHFCIQTVSSLQSFNLLSYNLKNDMLGLKKNIFFFLIIYNILKI